MKKILYAISALGAILCLNSCNKEEILNETEEITLSISVNTDLFTAEDGTKVSMQNLSLSWNEKDSLAAIKSSVFKRNPEPLAYCGNGVFSGKISRGEAEDSLLLIYPYFAEEYKRDDGRVMEIPFGVYQTAVKDGLPLIQNSIDPMMNGRPAIILAGTTGTANGNASATLDCRNALLKFKIEGTDIKEVYFTMSSGTMAADRAFYCYDSYTSSSTSKPKGTACPEDGYCETQTVVVRPQGETFQPGIYYASILPNNYTIAATVYNTKGQYISRTSTDKIDIQGGRIYTLGKKGGTDEAATFIGLDKLKSFSGSNPEVKIANYDFSRGGVMSRDASKKYTVPIPGAPGEKSNSNYQDTMETESYDMGMKNDAYYYLEKVNDVTYLKFVKGKNPYISCPAISAYTIKSAEVEFAEAYENVNVYFGKGAAPSQWNMTADHQKVHIGADKKAVVYTAHCTPYCRYYLLFNTTGSDGKEAALASDILIKKVTFTYAFGSWPGSWE